MTISNSPRSVFFIFLLVAGIFTSKIYADIDFDPDLHLTATYDHCEGTATVKFLGYYDVTAWPADNEWHDGKLFITVGSNDEVQIGSFAFGSGESTYYDDSWGHNSMGGFDMFKTSRQGDGSWSEPENLGFPINSPYDDLFLTASDSSMYLVSDRRGGKGKSDIYSIVHLPPVYIYVRPDSVIRKPVRFYTVSTIQFDLKAVQNDDAIPTLEILAGFLKSESGVKVLITGYTDTQGDHDYNMWLSKKRAEFVRDHLISMGVPGSAFIVEAKGPGKHNHLIVKPTEIPPEYQLP